MTRAIGTADSGNSGDSGDSGDSGSFDGGGGSISLASPVIRPIGVSPVPWQNVGEDFFRGNKWPPADLVWTNPGQPPVPWTYANTKQFPRSAWTGYFLSVAVLAEFVKATATDAANAPPTYQWDEIDIPDWQTFTAAQIEHELYQLYKLIDYRPGVMAEALAEIQGIQAYWQGLLMSSVRSHPATTYLMHIAIHIGEFQAMHYKYKWPDPVTHKTGYGRPRASQLSPVLMPPIAVPGHASYPSGHSTQTHLLSGLMAQVMPAAVTTALPINATPKPAPAFQPPIVPVAPASLLDRLAERVSRNREVLGLHYPSDTRAGKIVADRSLTLLLQCPTVIDLIAAAKQEWL